MRSNGDDDDSGIRGGRRQLGNGVSYKPRSPEAKSIANLGICAAAFGERCLEVSRLLDEAEGVDRALLVIGLKREISEIIDILSDSGTALTSLIEVG